MNFSVDNALAFVFTCIKWRKGLFEGETIKMQILPDTERELS